MKTLENIKAWHAVAVIAVGLALGGWQAYGSVDYWTSQITENTFDRMLRDHDRLLRKFRAERNLSTDDRIKFCRAARALQIGGPEVKALC